MAQSNDALIERFYGAFAQRDGAGMEACYAPGIEFSDPVFPDLKGHEAGAMWRMLTGQSQDLRLELLDHSADGDSGTAQWRAHYTFTRTGRKVVNDVTAKLRFADGAIVEHRDSFDFYRWSRQAFGLRGVLLGWTPLLRKAVQSAAAESLDKFIKDEAVKAQAQARERDAGAGAG